MRTASHKCMGCHEKRARKDSYFCTDRCGNVWAECYLDASEVAFCEKCGHGQMETSSPYPCDHCGYDEPEEDA